VCVSIARQLHTLTVSLLIVRAAVFIMEPIARVHPDDLNVLQAGRGLVFSPMSVYLSVHLFVRPSSESYS